MASLKEIQKDFLNLLKKKNLSQGYICFGESAAEQLLFSKKLANFLENGEFLMPEHLLFDASIIEEKGDSIGIDTIREAINFLWLKPIKSLKRTLIINDAFKLTAEAQNALLKISEEPPEHSLIILSLKDPEVLIPPLISRFQKIYFNCQCGKEINADEAKSLVKEFLQADYKRQREIIKEVIEDSQMLADFVKLLMVELRKEPVKNYEALRALLGRWQLINQLNVNKKLQLEAIINFLK